MKKSRDDERGKIKGAAPHAEGQHGERTHARFIEQLHEASADETDDRVARPADAQDDEAANDSGRNR